MLGVEDLDSDRDRSLIEALQLGDAGAFAELYRRHHDRLYRYCMYRLGEPHEAEDVVQEAFTRAWVNAPRLRGELRFYPWLRTIAGNLCTDIGRKRARVQPTSAVDPGLTDGGQDNIIERVDIALLEQAMSRLPERHREVLALRETDGLSYEQLAARTGTTVGTVESLLWRARQGLKRQFAVVSGESILAGVPVVGWLLRRAHAAHARATAQLAEWRLDGAAFGGAIGGIAVGSVVAVAVVVGGAAVSPATPPAAVATASSAGPAQTLTGIVQLVSPATPAAAPAIGKTPVNPVESATPAPAPASHPSRTVLIDPVRTDKTAAKQEAQQDPMRISAAGTTVGVNPQAVVSYVDELLSPHTSVP